MEPRARSSAQEGGTGTAGISAGQLEAALLACDGIGEARAVCLPGPDGTDRVVAYVVPISADPPLAAADVRASLSELLGAAAPGTIVVVDGPVTGLDAADLPPPWQPRPDIEPPYTPSRDEIEYLIASVWADALGLDRVGIHDDFFELGGNSFISVDVLALLAARGLAIDARTFFENPTVAELAAAAGERQAPGPVPG
jgi:Phosphopantetheine attachment site/AMP-binding enzyme C-terminal domain